MQPRWSHLSGIHTVKSLDAAFATSLLPVGFLHWKLFLTSHPYCTLLSVWAHGYYFIFGTVIQHYLIFLPKLVPFLTIRSSLSELLDLLGITQIIAEFVFVVLLVFWACPYFLVLWDTWVCLVRFLPVLELPILLSKDTRKPDLGMGMPLATGALSFLGPLRRQGREIHVHITIRVQKNTCKRFQAQTPLATGS